MATTAATAAARSAATRPTAAAVLQFWFEELSPANWFKRSDEVDTMIRDRFSALHEAAVKSELDSWRESPDGRLAEIIVLDQFSRNLYRESPRAFAADSMAVALVQEAVRRDVHKELPSGRVSFLYMPLMHSESPAIHEKAVELFGLDPAHKDFLDFEHRHKAIVDRFGRYPHRNAALGRTSTPEELEFLKEEGSSF
eukprot:m.16310 g.16310  ORF g.16310 m.16310 type:complete len:197 (-) comp3490_c1_seq1:189-779(-)